MMVGRDVSRRRRAGRSARPEREVVLEVRGLSRGRQVRDVSFTLRKGEILGFAGLMGAGRTEVARAIFGADPSTRGEILVNGEPVTIRTPGDAVEPRHRLPLRGPQAVRPRRSAWTSTINVVAGVPAGASPTARLRQRPRPIRRSRQRARRHAGDQDARRVDPAGAEPLRRQPAEGGHRQMAARATATILIFDEPTRGIDVGAKSEIYRLLNELARRARPIIMISSELPEILRHAPPDRRDVRGPDHRRAGAGRARRRKRSCGSRPQRESEAAA